MKPTLTATPRSSSDRRILGSVATQPHEVFNKARRQPPPDQPPQPQSPRLELASIRVQTHTLVLTGALHERSAATLEAGIERLCEEGITGITLDLRELDSIDATGVVVIAFRSALCKRRGYDFSVIPGSPLIHRALEQGGVTDLLTLEGIEA